MDKAHRQLGEILLAKGLITERQLQNALEEQRLTKEFLGKILLKRRLITENDFLETLSEQFGLPYVRLKNEDIDLSVAMQFSSTLILDYRCFPIKQDEDSVTVAITNPLDALALSAVERASRVPVVKFVLASEGDIDWIIQRYQKYKSANMQKLFGE